MKLQSWPTAVKTFLQDEDGPTAVEYAVMLAFIVVACIGSVTLVAQATNGSLEESGEAIKGAFGG